MFIVQIHFKVPLSEVDKYQQAHREYLEYHYKQDLLLASGPMVPRTGGILIALTKDKTALEKMLQNDPYHLAGLSDYEIIEFSPVKHRNEINALILAKEGKLC